MSTVAALLSLALFIVFAGSAIQKFVFSSITASAAEHLGFSKTQYVRIGAIELAGALGLISGLSATTGLWAILNEVAAGGLTLTMLGAFVFHRRAGDKFKGYAGALIIGLACATELVIRLSA
ncbi:MAG: DoxX family protein [Actinomycetota bacterium]|jgi:hypothetical protein